MPKYALTNQAVEDLSGIWQYTFDTWSERQADKYYSLLIDSFEEIARRPEIGRAYPEVGEQIFGLKVGRHLIFYSTLNRNEILVIRILHELMDLKNKF